MLALAVLVFGCSCAKTGDPHPPELLIPRPPSDLSVRQLGDTALLSVSMPSDNLNGTPVTTLAQVEVYRLTEDASEEIRQLPEQEFLNRSERVLAVAQEALQAQIQGNRLTLRDALNVPDRDALYTRTLRYALKFVNRKRQSGGITNQATFSPIPLPFGPAGVTCELTRDCVQLRWQAPLANMNGSKPPTIGGYNVYRSEDPQQSSPVPLNRQPLSAPEYADREFQYDKTYYYQVSVLGGTRNPAAESFRSEPLRVETRDTFAPGAPRNLNGMPDQGRVILVWAPPEDNDVGGYRVYRKGDADARPQLLHRDLLDSLSFTDAAVDSGKKYVYNVTAVDTHGNESAPAEAIVEVP
jgi:hypothetical protein